MSDKDWALKLVQDFKARGAQATTDHPCAKDGLWLNVCRNKVAEGLENRIIFPRYLNQKSTNVCGVAAFVRQWIEDDPIGFAWLGISLYEKGHGYLGRGKYHGKEIKPSKELLNSPIPTTPYNGSAILGVQMNHADWIVMASIREAFNSVFNYSADEGIFAIKAWNFPSEVVATFKAAGYTSVVEETDWGNPQGLESLLEASRKLQNKWRVVLLIDMRMLDDKKMDSQSAIAVSDHWIGLQSPIKVSLVGSEYRVSKFTVFTWGGERTVPEKLPDISAEDFLKNYYGYIAAKY